jgi:hypothetical protein
MKLFDQIITLNLFIVFFIALSLVAWFLTFFVFLQQKQKSNIKNQLKQNSFSSYLNIVNNDNLWLLQLT